MADIKLIALDLDGTLLNSEKKISDRNLAALKAAQDKGVKVVLTTGRPLKAMDFFLHELGTDGREDEYTITFNGGLVQRNTGEILDKTVFSYDDVARIYEETDKLHIPLDAICEGLVYQIQSDQDSLYAQFNPALTFESIDFSDLSSQQTYNKCVTAYAQEPLDAAIEQISPELFERYEIFKSREMLLEWSPKNVHKANGLEKLIAHLGIERSQVMACCDEANDLSMIEWAGLGVAMQNAVVIVKEAANVVTPMTNDEDAVAWAIEEYVLKEDQLMGLFDRLFGRKKQEPPIEEVVNEALENIDDLGEETESVPEAGENLEAEAVQPYQDEQPIDDQISDTKASLADVEEQLVTEELASQAIQEESKEPEHERDIIAENQEVAQGATQTEETLEEHQPESSDETVEELVEQADLSDEASSHAEHEAASYDEVGTDSNNEFELETEAVPLTESEQVDQTADVAEESEAAATEEPVELPQEESTQEKYDRSLKKTRTGFGARLNAFFANFRSVDEEFFEDLEELLITSDVGVQVASSLTEELRYEARLENAKKPAALRQLIIEKLVDIYEKDGRFNEKINFQNGLTVMLFVGVNGVGKTTSIGKLAYKYKQQGKKVMLVAADTFRAGAVAQLAEWGRRVDVPVVTGPEKSDPASVVYDGMERAQAEQVDVLMIDTAGRLQNKDNLMAELEKIGRIIKRVDPEAPHETFLALDASTGQNALVQAKEFSKITPVTGIVLTKIDGTARGGVVLAIRQELDIPVKLIGFGEKIDAIGEFNSEKFM